MQSRRGASHTVKRLEGSIRFTMRSESSSSRARAVQVVLLLGASGDEVEYKDSINRSKRTKKKKKLLGSAQAAAKKPNSIELLCW